MSPSINRREGARFVRFSIVGIIGSVVDFGIFNFLTLVVKLNAVPASIVSFSLAVLSNFLWNRYWTYPDSRSKPVARQLLQFSLINIVGLLIRTPIFALLESPLRGLFGDLAITADAADLFGHNLALAVAIGVVLIWNFLANRFWTYNDVG